MSFFQDLEKKLSRAGQSAAQKTKEITEIAKLHLAISEEEKKVEALYCQIGKEHVALHEGAEKGDFTELVREIRKGERKIEENRKKILSLRGVRLCARCGAEMASHAVFCSFCGTPVSGDGDPGTENEKEGADSSPADKA